MYSIVPHKEFEGLLSSTSFANPKSVSLTCNKMLSGKSQGFSSSVQKSFLFFLLHTGHFQTPNKPRQAEMSIADLWHES
jgi:hypothetical protein